jgi:hypothetical protein
MIQNVESRFEFVHFLLRPILESLGTPLRKIVLALLQSRRTSFSVPDIAQITSKVGLPLDPFERFHLCNALWLKGILLYENYEFQLANPRLLELACTLGYLNDGDAN